MNQTTILNSTAIITDAPKERNDSISIQTRKLKDNIQTFHEFPRKPSILYCREERNHMIPK